MTPEQQRQFEQMKIEIENLKRSSTIPRDIETALRERLGIGVSIFGVSTGSASTQAIGLTGNPQTITVPAQPSGVITVTFNGNTYNLLYA